MGRNQSRDTMKNLAKKLDIDWHQAGSVSKDEAINNWKEARKHYFETKPLHEQWRDEFQQSAIDAIAEEEKIDREVVKKRRKKEKNQKILGGKSKILRGKGYNPPVFRAISKNEQGETIEHHDHISMVEVMAESNRRRQQQ